MKLKFNEKNQTLEFYDDTKDRLKASRLLSLLILIIGGVKLFLINWKDITEFDFVFIFLELVFIYLVYSNYWVKTNSAEIKTADIRFFKAATGMKSKAYFKLKNGKVREVYNVSSKEQRELIRKEVLKSGVAMK